MKRNGFTLIEVLVASLLMGMLVMILTMVFSQSSVAWRTGKASVAEMDTIRRRISYVQRQADDLLPGVEPNRPTTYGLVVSAWKDSDWSGQSSSLRKRAVEQLGSTDLPSGINPSTSEQSWRRLSQNFRLNGLGSAVVYAVGVWSYGPDGIEGTEDDITTWPDNME